MRKFVGLLLTLILVSSLGIASAQDGGEDPLADVDPSGATVVYWHEWDGLQGEGMDQIVANFNETNEWGITVEQVKLGSGGTVVDNVGVGITTGELPNLAGGAFLNTAQGWFLDNILVPFDAYVNSDTWGLSEEESAVINQSVLDVNRPDVPPFDGQLLAWPVGISANVMPTNLTMVNFLNEVGVIDFTGAPTTWEQFEQLVCGSANLSEGLVSEYAEVINNADLTETRGFPIGGGSAELNSFIYNHGGFIFDAEADRYDFTNDGAIAGLQYVQDLYNNGCMFFPEGGAFSNTNNEFGLGFSPVATGSSVGVPFIQGSMDEAGVEIDWVNTTMPWVEGERTLITFLRGVGMIRSTPEETLATWLFVKYWATDPEAQRIWTESAQYQPYNTATPGNLSEEFTSSNPQFTSFAEALEDPNINLFAEPSHPRSGEVFDIIEELYINITLNELDVEEAAEIAEEAANEAYEEALAELE